VHRTTLVGGIALVAATLAIAPAHARSQQINGDAEILSVAQTVNLGEVTESKGALDRANSADVKSFAALMIRDHGKALRQIRQVAHEIGTSGQPSRLSHQLAMQERNETSQLDQNTGAAFDEAFMQHEADEHRQVLNIIDSQLIPNAQSDAVANLLQQMRATVAHHLQLAQQLLAQLGGGTGS